MNELYKNNQLIPYDKRDLFESFIGSYDAIKTTPPPVNSVLYNLYQIGMVFRGFRLGMSIRDILNHFGDIELEKPVRGFEIFEHLTLTFAYETPDEIESFNKKGFFNYTPGWIFLDKSKFSEFSGIQEIDISFVNGLCNELGFSFDKTFIWRNIEEFTSALTLLRGLSDWIESKSEFARVLENDEILLVGWINTDQERIIKGCLSQFKYSASDEIFNRLQEETIENDLSWNNIEWGMSIQQIKEIYSKAEMLSEPKIYFNEYTAWLTIRKFPLLEKFYTVDFVTDSTNALVGIVLGLDDDKNLDREFLDLSNLLKQKYNNAQSSRGGYSL